ncbi:hypothetical protein SSS_00207 [Sarcoptes scabiei]|nr:hypothetical protein SSS_00207 [Sarcoptes scabiei]
MLTKASAQELGPKGIRVNSINPGLTITGMGRDIGEDRQHMERSKLEYQKLTILNRCAYPSEMADLVVFLASDLAKNITGSIMVSDGGMLVKKRHYFGSKS